MAEAGADLNEWEPCYTSRPLAVAMESGNQQAIRKIQELGGKA